MELFTHFGEVDSDYNLRFLGLLTETGLYYFTYPLIFHIL